MDKEGNTLIAWKLRALMTVHKINTKQLADAIGVSPQTIGNWRNAPTMPQLSGDRLDQLMLALNKFRNPGTELLELRDLVDWLPAVEDIPGLVDRPIDSQGTGDSQ